MGADYSHLPADLPVPEDDGAADHLSGMALPQIHLPSTLGDAADLAEIPSGLLVVYVYPRTGTPGEPSPTGWDDIPGARGCTPQSCTYRDSLAEFLSLAGELRLPTFEADGMTLYKRLTLIGEEGKISKVFYPVFPPDRNAAEVIAWLRSDRA